MENNHTLRMLDSVVIAGLDAPDLESQVKQFYVDNPKAVLVSIVRVADLAVMITFAG